MYGVISSEDSAPFVEKKKYSFQKSWGKKNRTLNLQKFQL